MKKIVRTLLLLFLFMPFMVFATQFNYDPDGINKANSYINGYGDRNKYLIFNRKYGFNAGNVVDGVDLSNNKVFYTGGMLSKDEYVTSISDGGSYLSPGTEYWTLTPADGSKVYTVSHILTSGKHYRNDSLGVRVTQYVSPTAQVTGTGRRTDPWVFVTQYRVSIESTDKNMGTVEPNTLYLAKGASGRIELKPKGGYRYVSNTCNLSQTTDKNYLRVDNINSDMGCLVDFDRALYTFTLDATGTTTAPNPSKIWLVLDQNWYSDENMTTVINTITPPTKRGHTFAGYYYGVEKVINGATDTNPGKIVKKVTPTNLYQVDQTLTAHWTTNNYTCAEGTYLAKNAVTCSSCKVGSFCPGGSFDFSSTTDQGITSCPAGYTSVAGAKTNTNCYIDVPDGKYKTSATGTATQSCPAGTAKAAHKSYYNSADKCDDCAGGTYAPVGSKQCTQCGAGKWSAAKSGSCSSCPSGYTSLAGSTSQASCYITVPNGKYKTTATGSTTTNCPAGTYSTSHKSYYNVADSCTNCAAGQWSAAGASSCSSCPNGYTSDVGAAGANTSCYINVPDGKYKRTATGTATANCAAGTYKAAHKSYYNVADSCTRCAAGTYAAAGSKQCTQCSAGYYSGAGASTCTRCAAGTYSAAGASSCTNCAAGTYAPAGSSSCTQCPAGKYSAAKAGSCSNCPSGYTSAAGAKANTECYINVPNGKRKTTATGSATTNCAAGYYNAEHKSYYNSADSCSKCAAGTYSSAGATTCTKCAAGKYSAAGASTCTNCPAGTYSATAGSTTCTNCPAGKWSNAGATSCTGCPNGYTSDAKAAGQSSCYINVSAGKYKSSLTGTTTTNCSAGYYSTAHKAYYNVADSCSKCAAGKYSASAGSSSCTNCPAGKYSGAGSSSCSNCPAGTYSAAGASSCTNCPAGKYQPNAGQSSCLNCPSGQTSNAGATSCFAATKTCYCPGDTACDVAAANCGRLNGWCTCSCGSYVCWCAEYYDYEHLDGIWYACRDYPGYTTTVNAGQSCPYGCW